MYTTGHEIFFSDINTSQLVSLIYTARIYLIKVYFIIKCGFIFFLDS